MNYVRAFAAGFVSTLVFHQGVLFLMQLLGAPVPAVWSMEPTAPLGVPKVISLAFWGGVWGIPIWYLMRHATGKAYWLRAIVFGAIGPTAVAFLVVVPLKGGSVGAGWDPKLWIGGLIVNAAWGFGLAVLIRWFRRLGF